MSEDHEKQPLMVKDALELEKECDAYIKKGRLVKIIKTVNPESRVRIGKNVTKHLNTDVDEIIELIFTNLEYDAHNDSFTFVTDMAQPNSSVPTTLLPNTFGKCIKDKLMVAFPSVKKVNALFINQLHHLVEEYLVKLIEYYVNSMNKRTTLSVKTINDANKNIKINWYKILFEKSIKKLKNP
jgi:histone H3/H4